MTSGDNTPEYVRHQPRQLGRAGRGPRGVPRLRGPAVPRRSELPVGRDPVRPAAAGLGRGPARRAPAVPHRHRHAVAGPARRADDRCRLLTAFARGGSKRWRTAAGTSIDYLEANVYAAPSLLGYHGSTSSSPGSGPCAGCRTSPSGRRSSPTCSSQADASSSARGTRCFGRSTSHAPTGSSSTTPYFETEHPLVDEDDGTYVETDVAVPQQPHAHVEPRSRRDRHRLSATSACRSPGSSSTTRRRGTRCRVR